MRLGTFTADILVDGKPLEQYDVAFESPTKVTCWIPSEEGKVYHIQRCVLCHFFSTLTFGGSSHLVFNGNVTRHHAPWVLTGPCGWTGSDAEP